MFKILNFEFELLALGETRRHKVNSPRSSASTVDASDDEEEDTEEERQQRTELVISKSVDPELLWRWPRAHWVTAANFIDMISSRTRDGPWDSWELKMSLRPWEKLDLNVHEFLQLLRAACFACVAYDP